LSFFALVALASNPLNGRRQQRYRGRRHKTPAADGAFAIENAGKWLICHPDAQRASRFNANEKRNLDSNNDASQAE
jgi:hypothetical protein